METYFWKLKKKMFSTGFFYSCHDDSNGWEIDGYFVKLYLRKFMVYGIHRRFQQYLYHIVAISFIGGETRVLGEFQRPVY